MFDEFNHNFVSISQSVKPALKVIVPGQIATLIADRHYYLKRKLNFFLFQKNLNNIEIFYFDIRIERRLYEMFKL